MSAATRLAPLAAACRRAAPDRHVRSATLFLLGYLGGVGVFAAAMSGLAANLAAG